MVLTRTIGELGLQEEILARDHARAITGGEALPYSGFKVMPPLVRRVNAAKARSDGKLRERRRAVLLPGGAIEKSRNR